MSALPEIEDAVQRINALENQIKDYKTEIEKTKKRLCNRLIRRWKQIATKHPYQATAEIFRAVLPSYERFIKNSGIRVILQESIRQVTGLHFTKLTTVQWPCRRCRTVNSFSLGQIIGDADGIIVRIQEHEIEIVNVKIQEHEIEIVNVKIQEHEIEIVKDSGSYVLRNIDFLCDDCEAIVTHERLKRQQIEDEQRPHLKTMPYQKYLQTEHWKRIRKRALGRARYHCQMCGRKNTQLDVHHNSYEHRGEEEFHMEDVVVVCHDCHSHFHGKDQR